MDVREENIFSILAAIDRREFWFSGRDQPIILEPYDVLIFHANMCHYGGTVSPEQEEALAVHLYSAVGRKLRNIWDTFFTSGCIDVHERHT